LHVEAAGPTSCNSAHANSQALSIVHLAISVALVFLKTGVASWKCLCSVTDDLEDINREAVSGVVKLFVKTLAHVFLLDWLVDKRRDDGLRVPVRETMHNRREFFVRIDGSIASFLVFEGSICVNCSLYYGVSDALKAEKGTYFVVWLGSSFDMQRATCRKEEIVQQRRALLP
jgi:hypothetical protein